MVTNEAFRKMALSFPGTEEHPHFERRAFKVTGKTIFATMHEEDRKANINLTPEDQSVYSSYEGGMVYPIPNKFGLSGWTTFELDRCPAELVSDALFTAYQHVLNKKKNKGRSSR